MTNPTTTHFASRPFDGRLLNSGRYGQATTDLYASGMYAQAILTQTTTTLTLTTGP
jgi:hypothetical protein